jgi:hypothetical protein
MFRQADDAVAIVDGVPGGGLVAVVLIGVPTALLPTPWSGRAIPPRPPDRVFLIPMALLCAALAATDAPPVACPTRERSLTAGDRLSFFASGCPFGNKLVALALGSVGARNLTGKRRGRPGEAGRPLDVGEWGGKGWGEGGIGEAKGAPRRRGGAGRVPVCARERALSARRG